MSSVMAARQGVWSSFRSLGTLRRQFQFLALLIALLSLAVGATGGSVFRAARGDLQQIRHNAAKVVAAQTMSMAVERIGASGAEFLLQAKASGGSAGLDSFESEILEHLRSFDDALFEARANTVAGQPDEETVRTVVSAFTEYRWEVAGMLLSLRHGRQDEALAHYQTYSQILTNRIHPSLLRLDRLDRQDIERGMEGAQVYLQRAGLATKLLGGFLVALILYVAVRLTRLTRRRVNPGLLPAMLIASIFLWVTGAQIARADRDLQAVAQESFDSLHLSVQIQETITAGRAAQTRWMIDPGNAISHDLAFGHTDRQVRSLLDLISVRAQAHDEAAAVAGVRDTYEAFFQRDAQLRGTVGSGDLVAALRLSGNEVRRAFQSSLEAVGRVYQMEQGLFTERMDSALAAFGTFQPVTWAAYLAIAAMAVVGTALRLKDF